MLGLNEYLCFLFIVFLHLQLCTHYLYSFSSSLKRIVITSIITYLLIKHTFDILAVYAVTPGVVSQKVVLTCVG